MRRDFETRVFKRAATSDKSQEENTRRENCSVAVQHRTTILYYVRYFLVSSIVARFDCEIMSSLRAPFADAALRAADQYERPRSAQETRAQEEANDAGARAEAEAATSAR